MSDKTVSEKIVDIYEMLDASPVLAKKLEMTTDRFKKMLLVADEEMVEKIYAAFIAEQNLIMD